MLNKIKTILNSKKDISAWIISESKSSSAELFFVKDRLDMNRATDVHEYALNIFVDFTEENVKYRGDASVLISPSDSDTELEQKIERAAFSAGFVKNKWYPLPKNENKEPISVKKYNNIEDLKNNYSKIQNILFKEYPYKSKINSCELFAIEQTKRTVTSEGIDISYPFSEFTFEIVSDNNYGKELVEIFNDYYLPNIDLERLETIVKKQLAETDGRSQALDCKKLENTRVLLSGDAVEELLFFYLSQATDKMIYMNISKVKQGEQFVNNKLNITLDPALPSSLYAKPVDHEGKILEKYTLFENGKAINLRTSSQFSHYLNLENKGQISTFVVDGGDKTYDELTSGDYIEILTFSSFLMDSTTGDFGGEFRLAKLVQDGKESYVSGGALSENIFKLQDKMMLSKELEKRTYSVSPKAIAFDNVSIAAK
ncbi:MAG: metallopeptidase TldD-related protein [Eubacteriales bacterium]|nr:metallopeptidase TldD-related protein [Eubacteriales bacterium]